ncbi:MAG: proton-conducting transporter membrane subunit [Bellilinea sp.]|jgi:formate hydrogenlyase subunit 3/multisubunit Na+/H+ antiporter MnhD subunit
MSAPVIWIVLPLIAGIVLWFLRQNRILSVGLAVFLTAALALLAAFFPIGEPVRLGGLRLELTESLVLLGRRFVLSNNERSFLTLIYGAGAAWFIGAFGIWVHRFFVPFALAVLAALVAAFSVEPFLFAALLVEVAVLFSIPLLAPPGEPVKTGVQRYLIFQTLGMPFVLFAGWVFGSGDAAQINAELLIRAALMLGLGFALWLAIFPFFSWVPQLVNETHPFAAAFVLSFVPVSILMLGLDFVSGFGWLRSSQQLFDVLRIAGILMITTGGIWAASQDQLPRLLGFAVIFETGFALLAIGLNTLPGLMLFAAGLLPRFLALFVLALALGILKNHRQAMNFDQMKGVFQRYPFTSIALLTAIFSMSGIPLLAGFPVRLELLEQVARQSVVETGWALAGNLGFLIGGLRVLLHVVRASDAPFVRSESLIQRIILLLGSLFLLLFGLLPGVFYQSVIFVLRIAPALLTPR